tara:strand:+ start:245 stop:838 length:594 start_codon:yes stop_codon:yes gene_type:complete
MIIKNYFKKYKNDLFDVLEKLDLNELSNANNLIEKTIKRKSTIYVCGNGGSHAIANHFVCDYFKGLSQDTSLNVKIKSLCSDNSLISAISNDFSYDDVFVYQAKRYFKKNDILILISSSGNSNNIKKILNFSLKKKIKVIGITGFNGGYLKKNCNISLHCNVKNYGISEDFAHILMHLIMQNIKLNNLKINKNKAIL